MKKFIERVLQNELFLFLMYGVFVYIIFTAIVIAVLQVPAETILNSGLKEILMVFEG